MSRSHLSDQPIRGHIRTAGFSRVAHGLFLRNTPGISDEDELIRVLLAWLLVLPAGAAFTHVTAARLMGWQLPALPEQVPVFAAVDQRDNRPRRPGLICSRVLRGSPPRLVRGLPVEPAEEVLLRAGRDLGLLDLIIMVDSARRLGDVDADRMESLLRSRRPGVRALRRAWGASRAETASAGESVLRVFDATIDVDTEPQVVLHDHAGNMIGVVDLLVRGTRLVHEYDGAHHRDLRQHRSDLRRDRALARGDYERRGFTLDDLVNHPGVVMHEVDRDLGRAHVRQRLARWRRLLGNSLYSEAGRRRVMNRWQRQMGVTDWSGTA